MRIIFIGQFVSVKESFSDSRISQAGNNFQLKFIEMAYPILSISLYPIFLRSKSISTSKNIVIINNQTLFIDSINKLIRLIFDTIQATVLIVFSPIKHVFFYNLDRQNFILFCLLKFIFRKKVYIILADYPYFNNKSIFEKVANFVIKKSNGLIVLNSNILLNKNQMIISGLLRTDQIYFEDNLELNNNVLLSGSLGATTGLEIALKTFSEKPDFNLFITGRPYGYNNDDFNLLLNKYISKYNNIKYLGLLEPNDYLNVLKNCDFALSLRNPADLEHQFNFPSKILEYLSMSKLVISSLSYTDLPKDFLFITSFDSDSLGKTLDQIKNSDPKTIQHFKLRISNYLKKNFTEKKLEKIINNLINYD